MHKYDFDLIRRSGDLGIPHVPEYQDFHPMPQLTELFQTLPYGPAPESDAAAFAWLDSHDRRFDLFINNQWTPPADGRYLTATPTRPRRATS